MCMFPIFFSPNGDGKNDVFKAYAGWSKIVMDKFHVFDRWGNLVFESKGKTIGDVDYGWNGRVIDQDAMEGVYTYTMVYSFPDCSDQFFKKNGSVTLVR